MATIYKIEFDEYIYIGSTKDMKERKRYHNYALRKNKTIHHKSRLYTIAREKGKKELELIAIEECSIDDRFIREQHYIDVNAGDKLLNCVNPIFDKKEYMKEYREKNKERIKEQMKAYHEKNKERHKEYELKRKDIINQRRRELRALKKQAELNDI